MAPTVPPNSFVLAVKWLTLLPIKEGQRFVINHPQYGVIVKKVALVDKNGLIWSQGENNQSLSIEELGPVNINQISGRIIWIFKPRQTSL